MATVTKSIGTSSRDYSTITSWEADLDNGAVYSASDDAVGECYNDSAFDEQIDINGGTTIGLTSITLGPASGEGHDGTAASGVRLTPTADDNGTALNINNEITTVYQIEVDYGGLRSINCVIMNGVCTVSRLILHDVVRSNGVSGISLTGLSGGIIFDSIIYDIESSNGSAYGISEVSGSTRTRDILNNTVYNCVNTVTNSALGIGIQETTAGANKTYTNNISCGNSGDDIDVNGATSTESYNISSDSTAAGTGSITGVTTADQFVSTTGGSEDLHLKSGSDALEAGTDLGTTPTGVNIDIDGCDRNGPDNTVWSIGAHQKIQRFSIGTTSRDYSTITAWEADLDNTTYLSANSECYGECYNDSAFDEAVTVNGGGTVGLASRTLTVASGERHDGTAGVGARIVRTSTGTSISVQIDDTTVEWIEIDGGGENANQLEMSEARNVGRNIISHNADNGGSSHRASVIINVAQSSENDSYIANIIVYDITASGFRRFHGISLSGTGGQECDAYNCTVFNTGGGSSTNRGIQASSNDNDYIIQNCIAVQTNGVDGLNFEFGSGGTHEYNLSEDVTADGTGSITGVSAADLFVSTTGGSEDLHLKDDSPALESGTPISVFDSIEIDIDGIDRNGPSNPLWSIGAHQRIHRFTVGTSSRDFSTLTLFNAGLSGYTGQSHVIADLYNDSEFTDDRVNITDTPDKITVQAAEGEGHDGTYGTGVSFSTNSSFSHWWIISVDDVTGPANCDVIGLCLEISQGTSTSNQYALVVTPQSYGGAEYSARRNIIRKEATYDYGQGIRSNGTTGDDAYVTNNIVYGFSNSIGIIRLGGFSTGNHVYNNTVYGCNIGFGETTTAGTIDCGNNLAIGNTTGDFNGDFASTGDYNCDSDGTAPGANSITSDAATEFVSTVGGLEDLRLKSGALSIDAGNDEGTTYLGIQFDINNYDRDSNGVVWDIGAHEFIEVIQALVELSFNIFKPNIFLSKIIKRL